MTRLLRMMRLALERLVGVLWNQEAKLRMRKRT